MSELRPDPDLNRLVEELNRSTADGGEANGAASSEASGETSAGPAATGPAATGPTATGPTATGPAAPLPRRPEVEAGDALAAILQRMQAVGASDLLLVDGEPPVLRRDGELIKEDSPPLDGAEIRGLFLPYLPDATRRRLAEEGAADLALGFGDGGAGGRYRVNLHRQRGTTAAAVRALPRRVPTLDELNLPPQLARLVEPTRGLVLVCGPTGSGKTSTLAALVGEINRRRRCHVITIEEPIEYLHDNGKAVVEQIEIGHDSPSFAAALRACLRQDPDVILVGEMRDLETVATALSAAETGHLILATLHSNDVAQAIHRMVDVFPPAQQTQIRHQLTLSLNAILCQQLVPRCDGKGQGGQGRVPAVELLLASYPVRNHIRKEALQNLYNEITLGQRRGMIALEASLADLVRRGVVEREEAFVRSTRPDELESLLAG